MVRCNWCEWIGEENDLIRGHDKNGDFDGCPICKTDAYLIDREKKNEQTTEQLNLTDLIIQYETGELAPEHTLKLFAELVRTGQAWALQGHYGRTSQELIKAGYISKTGEILREFGEEN